MSRGRGRCPTNAAVPSMPCRFNPWFSGCTTIPVTPPSPSPCHRQTYPIAHVSAETPATLSAPDARSPDAMSTAASAKGMSTGLKITRSGVTTARPVTVAASASPEAPSSAAPSGTRRAAVATVVARGLAWSDDLASRPRMRRSGSCRRPYCCWWPCVRADVVAMATSQGPWRPRGRRGLSLYSLELDAWISVTRRVGWVHGEASDTCTREPDHWRCHRSRICFRRLAATRALQWSKNFQNFPQHQIFRRIHRILNINEHLYKTHLLSRSKTTCSPGWRAGTRHWD